MATEFDVIVIGGGLAGLAAGATVAAGGAGVVVLESRRPGGRARSTERDGFHFNLGPHALYSDGPGMKVLRSLGVQPKGHAPPLDSYRLLSGGHLHLMPAGPRALMRTSALGWRSKAQLGRLLATLRRLDPEHHAANSVNQWLTLLDLRPDADALVRALIRLGTYAADFDAFSAGAAIAQLQAASRAGVLYIDGGWKSLVEALVGKVEVRPRQRVASVELAGGMFHVAIKDTDVRDAHFVSKTVVLAAGNPMATRGVVGGLVDASGLGDLGSPVTAACLDVGVARIPKPGYVLSADEPLYVTTQAPPAHCAPPGEAIVSAIRYGSRSASEDRPELQRLLRQAGVADGDVLCERFLPRMVVSGSLPRADRGGLRGRPKVTALGLDGLLVAGDWVGPDGLLADASLASGRSAGLKALELCRDGARDVESVV